MLGTVVCMQLLRVAEAGHKYYEANTPVLAHYDSAASIPRMSEYAVAEVDEVIETLVHGFTLETLQETVDVLNFLMSLKEKIKAQIDFATWRPHLNGYGKRSGAVEDLKEVVWDAGHTKLNKERALEEAFMRVASIIHHMPPHLRALFAPTVWAVAEKVINNYLGRLRLHIERLSQEELHELYQVQRPSTRLARNMLGKNLGAEEQEKFAELLELDRWKEISDKWGRWNGLFYHRPALVAGMFAVLPDSTVTEGGVLQPYQQVLRLPPTQ